jgi:putative endonuclease
MSTYFVYILTNKANRVLYIGVTNDLSRRMYEHKNALINGFTKKYHINKLVYNECFSNMKDAILREKQLKAWRREKKIALIESTNPSWNELSI